MRNSTHGRKNIQWLNKKKWSRSYENRDQPLESPFMSTSICDHTTIPTQEPQGSAMPPFQLPDIKEWYDHLVAISTLEPHVVGDFVSREIATAKVATAQAGNAAVRNAFAMGMLASQMKERLDHGKYEAWVRKYCRVHPATALRFTAFSKAARVQDLANYVSLRAALKATGVMRFKNRSDSKATKMQPGIGELVKALAEVEELLGRVTNAQPVEQWSNDDRRTVRKSLHVFSQLQGRLNKRASWGKANSAVNGGPRFGQAEVALLSSLLS
jgi:hypothetical protein